MATSLDLAYAAGIMDGEGYFGIIVSEKDQRRPGSSPTFQAVVNVGMADLQVVAWLHDTFGGNLHSYEPGRYGTKRGVHHWRLVGQKGADFCAMILPYLKLKQGQAELLVRYRNDLRLRHDRRGGNGGKLPAEEIEVRRGYVAEIKAMNQRKVA